MSEVKYTKDHEWVVINGSEATVGVTDFAQAQLGDVVFVELPEIDTQFEAGDEVAVIESVKAAGEIVAPLTGMITAVNEKLADDPELVNQEPMGDGWFFKMHLADDVDLSELMSEAAYQELVAD